MERIPRLIVSAAHKSSGKTVTTLGLCAALADRGLKVQPFKKGPDYIDPMWLSASAGTVCRNLDYFMFGWKQVLRQFAAYAPAADISIIEGNKGLHDSIEVNGEGSTASLARKLNAPVVLVLDASKITRGIAPLLLGYKMFEPDIDIAGIILNKVAGARQETKLRKVLEEYIDIPLLGCMRSSPDMEVLERHLGLVPVKEDMGLYPSISAIAAQVSASVDIDKIISIANAADSMDLPKPTVRQVPAQKRARIGVMLDQAFTFYYPENLEALQHEGAQLVPINALRDSHLPDRIDGLYIGGGFPETMMDKLEENESLRNEIAYAVMNGLPVHAECGGLIYLAKSITWNDKKCRMVGALDCQVNIRKKPKGHGYMTLLATGHSPWLREGLRIRAHEFHYGELTNLRHRRFAYRVERGSGISSGYDGIVYKNVTASFAHLHHLGCRSWAGSFVSFAEKMGFSKNGRQSSKLLNDQEKLFHNKL